MAKTCSRCGTILIDYEECECAGNTSTPPSTKTSTTSTQGPADLLAIAGHLGTLLGCFFGLAQLLAIGSAQSAPQQAAAAAMAVAYVAVPYCGARAIGEIGRHLRGQ